VRTETTERPTRRALLKQAFVSGGILLSGLHRLVCRVDAAQQGVQTGVVAFSDEEQVPLEVALGSELDGRLFADLSALTPEDAVTPTRKFYVRTRASKLLDTSKPWSIALGGLMDKPAMTVVPQLQKMAKPMGLHLMECAGNFRGAHFGMVSVADWRGVFVEEIVESMKPSSANPRVLISGFDRYSTESSSSVPGASWIFTREQLRMAGAFFAIEMNAEPLTQDHGAPVRLVVPGWYGCTCIKWVNEVALVDDDARATSQMQEYAARTMQNGMPRLAKEYQPATIDYAAMPIRIEKWVVNGKTEFHVMGIQWGGSRPVEGLAIQFNPNEAYVPVKDFRVSQADTWHFWRYVWMPEKPGRYQIRLRATGPGVAARRLDAGYYMRSVEIGET
jgi:DMSO/TMAO reductase YedYZ molybdopterin-dependent catalytic subunit